MTKKYILLSILLLLLTTCGGYDHEGTSGTGNIAFKIDWQGAPTTTQKPNDSVGQGFSPSYAPLDCNAAGVSTVSATVYDSSNNLLATGGPWNCSDRSGYIYSVPAGSNRKVVVLGKDSSGNVLYSGEQTGITVVDGQTNYPVTITATSFVPTGVSASAGNGQVTISWNSVSVATFYRIDWSTTSGVTKTTGEKIYIYGGVLSYTHTGLTNGTTYYYVVTAFRDYDRSESSESRQVNATPTSSTTTTTGTTVTDIDGNVYNSVTIGTQVWMKENLKVTKYRNGDAIPTTTSNIPNDSSSKYQWAYNNDENNVATYGRLYTWYAATDSRGLCPTGWHVPTDAEWTTLTDYLGGVGVAGGKMKEAGTHWITPNTGADNSSGFTGLPGGVRYVNGPFYGIGISGYWWSATEYYTTYAWFRKLSYNDGNARRTYYDESDGHSIRCVRD